MTNTVISHFYGDSKNTANKQTKQNESTLIDTENKGVGSREESVRGFVKHVNYKLGLPSTSARIKSCVAAAADSKRPLTGVQSGEQK